MPDVPEVDVIDDPSLDLLRVHPLPELLRRPPVDLDPAGMNRFDDPYREYGVRYLATNLRGCLIECMARFRPVVTVETFLASVDGIDVADVDPTRDQGLLDWLEVQQVGHCHIAVSEPRLVDIDRAEALVQLDKHPLVRDALANSGLGTEKNPARLDGGVIRIGGPIGRPITQAVSRAVYEWLEVDGLRYASRIDDTEPCWALYEHCRVDWPHIEQLSPSQDEHRTAVRAAAALFEIELPEPWN